MNSSITKEFRKRLERLPDTIRVRAIQSYALWRDDPDHPGLHFKRVSQKQPIYSVRIGLGYRALGLRELNHIYWFWIGSHSEYDDMLKRL